ncbi:MAG: hypothetical protein KDA61_23190, partial [Planctomycetales bacterium]|nr:hypothetical protein [Planctomycetales bacterium]
GALQGKRIGLYGPGWRTEEMSPETSSLYSAAIEVLASLGAELVENPFDQSGFAALASPTEFGDLRGDEAWVYEFEKFLEQIRPSDAENSIEELKADGVNLFDAGGPLNWVVSLFPVGAESLKDPDIPPDLSEFSAVRMDYRRNFSEVMEAQDLDVLVYPQMLVETPPASSNDLIRGSAVDEIDILGTPGVTVPAGYYESGAPFSLIFLGDLFSEPELLGYAYDYEQATLHRVPPANLVNAADFNSDGAVDLLDFERLRDGFGRRGNLRSGDANRDNFIDLADFVILKKNFGYGVAQPVPEPSALQFAGFAAILGWAEILRRRRN